MRERMEDADWVSKVIAAGNRRCDLARFVGGIAHHAVVERGLGEPAGHWFDVETAYWIPVGVSLDEAETLQ